MIVAAIASSPMPTTFLSGSVAAASTTGRMISSEKGFTTPPVR